MYAWLHARKWRLQRATSNLLLPTILLSMLMSMCRPKLLPKPMTRQQMSARWCHRFDKSEMCFYRPIIPIISSEIFQLNRIGSDWVDLWFESPIALSLQQRFAHEQVINFVVVVAVAFESWVTCFPAKVTTAGPYFDRWRAILRLCLRVFMPSSYNLPVRRIRAKLLSVKVTTITSRSRITLSFVVCGRNKLAH